MLAGSLALVTIQFNVRLHRVWLSYQLVARLRLLAEAQVIPRLAEKTGGCIPGVLESMECMGLGRRRLRGRRWKSRLSRR